MSAPCDVHRVEVDVERVVAQAAHQLEALAEPHGVEGVGGGGVGGVLGARAGVDDRPGVGSVRIGIEEIGERRRRSGARPVLGGLPRHLDAGHQRVVGATAGHPDVEVDLAGEDVVLEVARPGAGG